MSPEPTLRWHDGRLLPDTDAPGPGPGPVRVADSWLVVDGAVRALDVHRERFAGSVLDAAPGLAPELDRFWSAVVAALPREGRWFPRVELVGDDLRLLLRPAPEARRSVVLATASSDPRTTPLVKGPDLEALGALRAEVATRGAEEAVLLDADGWVVEGAWSSLLWWRGDALCMPADDLPRLPGVTVRTVLTLAAVLGVDVLHERVTPTQLDGFEVWSLSALHGVRIATSWVDGPTTAEQPGRLTTWQRRLDALRRPLPTA
jgi:branched-subunit amino acid aminotransferase/4-amino-4-deoxychorismate lyase